MLLDWEDEDVNFLHPLPIALRPGASLKDGLAEAASGQVEFAGTDDLEHAVDRTAETLSPIVSLVLYLCSEHAELRDPRDPDRRSRRPQPTRTKRRLREFAASRVTTWEVAYRLGAALEQAQANVTGDDQGGTHASPRAHVRRAHCHTYWVGRGRPPIPVGVESLDDLVPTIHEQETSG